MKQLYFLLFLTFSFAMANAESCPAAGTTSYGGTQIIFSYEAETSFCANRPTTVEINGTTTYELDLSSCSETISVYNIVSGPEITGQDFTVTSGFDTDCSFSGGILPVKEAEFLNSTLRIYPSPLVKDNEVQVDFGFNVSAAIDVYSITGKVVLRERLVNKSVKVLNINDLSNGVYLIKIALEGASVTRKLVILK